MHDRPTAAFGASLGAAVGVVDGGTDVAGDAELMVLGKGGGLTGVLEGVGMDKAIRNP